MSQKFEKPKHHSLLLVRLKENIYLFISEKRSGSLQNLHDRPDRLDRTQLYPSDRGRLSRPGRLRSSG